MALTGKPSVIEVRAVLPGDTGAALRPLQGVIGAIRERLRLIEIEINALLVRTEDVAAGAGGGGDIDDLQEQIDSLRLRIEALEAITLTDWYVNGVFVSTRRVVNFIQGGGINISGADDETNQRANITFGALVDIATIVYPGGLRLSGREVGVNIGRQVDIQPGRLLLTGHEVGIDFGLDTNITVDRASLQLRGREVGIEITNLIEVAIEAGHLILRGREVGVEVTTPIEIAVEPAHLVLTGRDVTIDPNVPNFDFYREFSDLSTADLTVYQGSVSAATGNLVATPSSGSVHERVYFDLLPPGSPQFLSGAIEVVMNVAWLSSISTLVAIVFSDADSAANGTLQNGYWMDLTQQLSSARFIKFVSGGGSSVASGFFSGGNNNYELRVTRTSGGSWTATLNGAALWGPVSETTFLQWRVGVVFFANPGPVAALIDYGVNYT